MSVRAVGCTLKSKNLKTMGRRKGVKKKRKKDHQVGNKLVDRNIFLQNKQLQNHTMLQYHFIIFPFLLIILCMKKN